MSCFASGKIVENFVSIVGAAVCLGSVGCLDGTPQDGDVEVAGVHQAYRVQNPGSLGDRSPEWASVQGRKVAILLTDWEESLWVSDLERTEEALRGEGWITHFIGKSPEDKKYESIEAAINDKLRDDADQIYIFFRVHGAPMEGDNGIVSRLNRGESVSYPDRDYEFMREHVLQANIPGGTRYIKLSQLEDIVKAAASRGSQVTVNDMSCFGGSTPMLLEKVADELGTNNICAIAATGLYTIGFPPTNLLPSEALSLSSMSTLADQMSDEFYNFGHAPLNGTPASDNLEVAGGVFQLLGYKTGCLGTLPLRDSLELVNNVYNVPVSSDHEAWDPQYENRASALLAPTRFGNLLRVAMKMPGNYGALRASYGMWRGWYRDNLQAFVRDKRGLITQAGINAAVLLERGEAIYTESVERERIFMELENRLSNWQSDRGQVAPDVAISATLARTCGCVSDAVCPLREAFFTVSNCSDVWPPVHKYLQEYYPDVLKLVTAYRKSIEKSSLLSSRFSMEMLKPIEVNCRSSACSRQRFNMDKYVGFARRACQTQLPQRSKWCEQ